MAVCLVTMGAVLAEDGFVSRLLDKNPQETGTNVLEFYGRIQNTIDTANDSTASFMTMVLSYEHDSETVRLHFNMKEPGHKDFSETDFQWNAQLNVSSFE